MQPTTRARQARQAASAPAVHQARIAAQDARMPEELRNVLSRPVGYNAPLARSNAAFSIWK